MCHRMRSSYTEGREKARFNIQNGTRDTVQPPKYDNLGAIGVPLRLR